MIVTYTEEGWSIVLQRSHGLLAGQLCAHWKKDKQPARWVETLVATTEHDDVHNELESEDLLNEHGGPKNFKSDKFNAEDCNRLLARAVEKGRYVALLICRHISFLYASDPKAKAYCKRLKEMEKEWIRQAGATSGEISESYELLEFCDAMSLLICQGMQQPEHRRIEISNGPDGMRYTMWEAENQQLVVSPWPFEHDSITVNYETRQVQQLSFRDAAEFRKALGEAEVKLHALTIVKG
ncbi:DUF3891 family protein [Dyadobacter aurulentus]|uniref:DUF3891 family protein n=1 Tax=Dyadobacter sp. UC 10 TaxID=2605428 RepID=UPI0011F28204|nr:DUF3891 family protein [Dyadobacter sp. UC 10]KAA0988675.1 DUF3891 family protein [Dyadobacter sp. UC 10]